MKTSKILVSAFATAFLLTLLVLTSCGRDIVCDTPKRVFYQSENSIETKLILIQNGVIPLLWKGEIAVIGDELELRRENRMYFIGQQQIHSGITLLDESGVVLEPEVCDWDYLILLDAKKLAVIRKKTTTLVLYPIPKAENNLRSGQKLIDENED